MNQLFQLKKMILSEFIKEAEKNQIMKNIDEVVEDLQSKTTDVTTDIKTITKLN